MKWCWRRRKDGGTKRFLFCFVFVCLLVLLFKIFYFGEGAAGTGK